MEKSRLEAFSDGVLAIAITLLIIEVRVPHAAQGELWNEMLASWPHFAAYAVSFVIIGIIWVNHHGLMLLVERADRPLLFFNLLLLMFIVVIPFSTALLADYIRAGDNAEIAAAFYSLTMLCTALAFQALWRWITRAGGALRSPLDPATKRATMVRFGAGVVAYLGTVAFSFVSPIGTLGAHLLIALYYVFDQLTVRTPA
jgi:uncharacterized membrane protein